MEPLTAIVIVGAVAAVALAAKLAPGIGASRSRADTLARCAEIRRQLVAARVQGGDAVAASQLASQLSDCLAQAAAEGAQIDPTSAAMLDADTAYSQIEAEWAHYRSTDYSDSIKRNNTRGTMLRLGEGMAAAYRAAADAAVTPSQLAVVRASLLRSIDASERRRNCYLSNEAGCGRLGVSEPHGDDKAGDEWSRVLDPMIQVYRSIESRLVDAGAESLTDGQSTYGARTIADVEILDCDRVRAWLNAKLGELLGVEYTDSLRRKNIRAEILSGGAALVRCFRTAADDAIATGNVATMRALYSHVRDAYSDSVSRSTAFASGSSGYGRFGFDEADEATKAREEQDTIGTPLAVILNDLDRAITDAQSRASLAAGATRARFFRPLSRG